MCSVSGKRKQRDLRLFPPTRLSSASREHHVVCLDSPGISSRCCWKKNLGSKCHSSAPCAARKHRNTALAELSRCWALDMGFCSLPHPLSFEPLSNFTQQGTEDTYRSATVRCVGRKPRNDWWWLGLLQQQAFIPGKNHPICPEALLRNKTIYGSFCALGHLW